MSRITVAMVLGLASLSAALVLLGTYRLRRRRRYTSDRREWWAG